MNGGPIDAPMKVGDVKTRNPAVVDLDTPVREAADLMRSNGIRHLLVPPTISPTRMTTRAARMRTAGENRSNSASFEKPSHDARSSARTNKPEPTTTDARPRPRANR